MILTKSKFVAAAVIACGVAGSGVVVLGQQPGGGSADPTQNPAARLGNVEQKLDRLIQLMESAGRPDASRPPGSVGTSGAPAGSMGMMGMMGGGPGMAGGPGMPGGAGMSAMMVGPGAMPGMMSSGAAQPSRTKGSPNSVTSRLDAVEGKVERIEARLSEIERRLALVSRSGEVRSQNNEGTPTTEAKTIVETIRREVSAPVPLPPPGTGSDSIPPPK